MGISLSFLNQLTPYSIILKTNKLILHQDPFPLSTVLHNLYTSFSVVRSPLLPISFSYFISLFCLSIFFFRSPNFILLHRSSSLSHGNVYVKKLEVTKIALPCFQFRFHTSSSYFVFQFFSFDLPISSSSISISVSFSYHFLLCSTFCFRFCPNFVSLFNFVTAWDFATAIAIRVRSILPLASNRAITTFFSCSSFHIRFFALSVLLGMNHLILMRIMVVNT